MSGPVNSQSVLASTLVQRTKESREDSHVLYRIFGDGLCSVYCLFTILGYSKLILTNTSTELRGGMFNTYNLITPVYLIDFLIIFLTLLVVLYLLNKYHKNRIEYLSAVYNLQIVGLGITTRHGITS